MEETSWRAINKNWKPSCADAISDLAYPLDTKVQWSQSIQQEFSVGMIISSVYQIRVV